MIGERKVSRTPSKVTEFNLTPLELLTFYFGYHICLMVKATTVLTRYYEELTITYKFRIIASVRVYNITLKRA